MFRLGMPYKHLVMLHQPLKNNNLRHILYIEWCLKSLKNFLWDKQYMNSSFELLELKKMIRPGMEGIVAMKNRYLMDTVCRIRVMRHQPRILFHLGKAYN